jgi:predicted nucleic acid-binding protein
MIHAIDTDFLVAVEIRDHIFHKSADALARAEHWWLAREVVRIYPDGESVPTWIGWLRAHRLGRTRLVDTLLAASCSAYGISTVISNNHKDYNVFGKFEIIGYKPN